MLEVPREQVAFATPKPPLGRGGLAPWQVRRAKAYLLEQLDRDVPLVEVAGVVRLSPFHFCRAFKQSVGMTLSQWLLQRRMERAQELMIDLDRPLIEIAQEVGYTSQGAFGTAFRRLVGMTPGAWRRESRM
jgi:AraC family transcriptional regulator